MVDPQERVHIILADDSDNRILECAVAAGAEFIVTGDAHLLDLHSFREVRILSPRQFIDTIGSSLV